MRLILHFYINTLNDENWLKSLLHSSLENILPQRETCQHELLHARYRAKKCQNNKKIKSPPSRYSFYGPHLPTPPLTILSLYSLYTTSKYLHVTLCISIFLHLLLLLQEGRFPKDYPFGLCLYFPFFSGSFGASKR